MTHGRDPGKGSSSPLLGKRSKPPGLKEIAAHLNLSPATVSMVVNDAPMAKSLSADTRARVLAAIKEFNYRPNLVARALSKRESRTVGIIGPESGDGYFRRVMRGVEKALLDAGYLYFTASHLGHEDRIRESPSVLLQRGVDGLLFVNTPIYEHPGVPSVCVSHACSVHDVTSVLVNQQEGIGAAMQHLYDLGHRRILLVRGQPWSMEAQDRFTSTLAAARQLGLPTTSSLQMTLEGDEATPEVAFRAFTDLFARPVTFTAIFCLNDVTAIGAIRAMTDAGLSCPGDISVLGLDDISTTAFLNPRLTTASQPLEEMGAAAVEQLLARMRWPNETHPPQVSFPMTLRVRESTGPVSSHRPLRKNVASSVEPVAAAQVPVPPIA